MKMNLLLLLILCSAHSLFSQLTEQQVRQRLDMIHDGKIDNVRREIPSLERQYPNDAGVKYLDAYTTTDGVAAAQKYQQVVDQHPSSVWADAALYRVYQYYYAVGLYKTADAKMEQLRTQYPRSIYVKSDETETQTALQPVEIAKRIEEPVPVVSEEPEPERTPTSQSVSREMTPYVVQVGVFSIERTAQQQSDHFSKVTGTPAIVYSKFVSGKEMFAVGFSGFQSETEARNFVTQLKSQYNIDAFFVKR